MGLGEGCGGKIRARAKKDRKYIPAMPMPLAVICCILNFIIPGLGTILAGFCVCCCSRNEDMSCCEQFCSSILSILFGILQMILAPLLLVGWIWSCFWGVSFIGMSREYYHDNKPFDDEPQNTTITTQPGPNTYGPNQWSSPPGSLGPYGPQPGPSQGYPPGGQYSGQPVPSSGYPQSGQYSGQPDKSQGFPPGQFNQNQVTPSAPPQEPEYTPPQPGYNEPPPPYDFTDPYPRK